MAAYKLVWDDFCSWFLEMIKPAYLQPTDPVTYEATIGFFEKLIRILHPFMPFLTEEIWQVLRERKEVESIMVVMQPIPVPFNQVLIDKFNFAEEVIMAIRSVRKEKNIPQKDTIKLFVRKNNHEIPDPTFDGVVARLCNIDELSYVDEKVSNSQSFIVGSTEFFIPLSGKVNIEEELKKLEEELKYTCGFLTKVMQKLGNASFVNNAPSAVVESEHKKQQDAESRIRVLEQQIDSYRAQLTSDH
jgi:valyl-tRNA synthetase